MSNVIDAVMNQMSDEHVAAIARQLGTDPASAQSAIEHALPVLVGAMAHQASSSAGADLLHGLAGSHSGFDAGGLLGGLLGGNANSSAGPLGGGGLGGLLGGLLGGGNGGGGGILGQIFGAHHDHVSDGLGQATGLDGGRAAQLMALLAPLVLSALGRMTQHRDMSASDLGQELTRQTQSAHANGGSVADLLTGVLGRLGGGASGGGGFDLGSILGGLGRN